MVKLIGILIVILGFSFKIETLFTILVAGIATGLVAGLNFNEILTILGESFVANRGVSLFILTLPVIGVLERYGLKQRAVTLIKSIKNLTTGNLCTIYVLLRQIAGAFSIRIGGHPQFVRPIVNPMAQAAAEATNGKISEHDKEIIKAYSAASENFGNFFGQNLFAGSSGVLLIASTLSEQGYEVSTISVAQAGLIIAVTAFVIIAINNYLFDKKLAAKYTTKK
ncbi:hypothetical protein AN639_10735 [Candidatus Epulonipiscium fishelsonii]|uniref:Uncharacterized protein n=1 Tax=Candidatus Epulonipiscium fishelsonii TaxID=77094 RepID=A0ACC8XF91_9FIRM|nr:hypothetical protein AN396_00490 [Epulopiscium sp. SCG-B11WGA-EpuloA1]ONI43279.1 hypothetical protein AN639_10735 [Epulopiscium sp. SCG-B05WGA-EpuloA1]ONI47702.1 hypothetical protein AN644_04260 [Epulopiscium sp. SCG-C06WGA-EpuloA1]